MRLEISSSILVLCFIGIVIVLLLSRTAMPKKAYRILLALVVALTMPAFLPGHSEFVMLLPSGALFGVSSATATGAGIIFTIINYFIAWFFLYKVCTYFEN